MSEWPRVPLRELFHVQLGKMLSPGSQWGQQFPYLANRNVQWGRVVPDGLGTMHFTSSERARYRLKAGDLLVCEGGEVGRSALWRDEVPECYFQNAVHRLRPKGNIDPAFMRYYLEFAAARGELRSLTGQTSIAHLPREKFVRWRVPCPPLGDQRRIVAILETIDEVIRAAERLAAKSDLASTGAIRQALMALCEEDMVPVEQRVADVTVGIVVRPTQYYTEAGVPVLRSANVRESGLHLTDLVFMSPSTHARLSKTAVGPGDVLTVRTGYPGTTAVVPSTLGPANCVDVVITRTDGRLDPNFLALWANSDFGKGHVLARQGGLAQQHFNVGDMRAMPIPDVDRTVQGRVVLLHQRWRSRLDRELVYVEKVRAMRLGLAADLLSGTVRVGVGV